MEENPELTFEKQGVELADIKRRDLLVREHARELVRRHVSHAALQHSFNTCGVARTVCGTLKRVSLCRAMPFCDEACSSVRFAMDSTSP